MWHDRWRVNIQLYDTLCVQASTGRREQCRIRTVAWDDGVYVGNLFSNIINLDIWKLWYSVYLSLSRASKFRHKIIFFQRTLQTGGGQFGDIYRATMIPDHVFPVF